ncbi:MAG: elongation factor P [Deltaproteobacteria bacterium]|nr:elongation factor P [Deltaproteobacteria bacterium]
MFVPATQLRVGMIVMHQNDLHRIMELTHVTPGNWRGFVRTKLRNLRSGLQTEYKFRSEDKVDRVSLEQQEMEYLYQSGDEFHFMNSENYEQITLSRDTLGDSVLYLTPNLKIRVDMYQSEPVGISLPKIVDLQVTDAPPTMKSATVTNELKPATTETGLVVRVPSFIEVGDTVRVDTETGNYLSRAK